MSPVTPDIVAAIDMGSNSFHLLVARHDGGRLLVVDRLKERVALAEGLGNDLLLDEDAQTRGLDCLRKFSEALEGVPARAFRAVATSTLRRARNANEFLQRAEEILGNPVHVIPGVEEARLVFVGAISELPESKRRLIVDIGGGSTEIALGETQAEHTESLHMGCVNFTQGFFSGGAITLDRFRAASFAARLELEHVSRALSDESWQESVGSSGTARALLRIIRLAGWDDAITLGGLRRLRDALVDVGQIGQLAIEGLSERRRAVICGGLAIMLGVFEALGVESMSTTDGALREGVAFELVGEERALSARKATVERLIERYDLDAAQGLRVRDTTWRLFDQVSDSWNLRAEGRRILGAAARLHEVGLAVRYGGYHKHGAYILAQSDLPGFTKDEQQAIAALVLCHRRKFRYEALDGLAGPLGRSGRRLAVLLRLSVRLNRRRADGVPDVQLSAKKKKLELSLPEGWRDANPLTAAGLKQEQRRVERAGMTLVLE